MTAKALGVRLRELRKARGLSLLGAASLLGLHYTYLSHVENGRARLGEDSIRMFVKVIGGDVEELLALSGQIPAALRQRAERDHRFALLLRRLPEFSDAELQPLYQMVGLGDVT